jgi:hypothetical protein
MEEKTYRCPNCGATITNTQNCEYCGSLLVRFLEKGIDLKKTTYVNDDFTFPGLIAELKQNLELQKEHPDERVATDIIGPPVPNVTYNDLCRIIATRCYGDHNHNHLFPNADNERLAVSFSFVTYLDIRNSNYESFNERERKRHAKFQQLDCFDLFKHRSEVYTDVNRERRNAQSYDIDFGSDAVGAARLISHILLQIEELDINTPLSYYTNYGNNIEKVRKALQSSSNTNSGSNTSQYYEAGEKTNWKKILYITLGAVIFFLFLLSQCS